MLEEVEHGGAEPAYTFSYLWVKRSVLFATLGWWGHGAHEDAAGLRVGHHELADVCLGVIEALEGGAVDGIDEDTSLGGHLLALLDEGGGLHAHGACLHDKQVDGDRK